MNKLELKHLAPYLPYDLTHRMQSDGIVGIMNAKHLENLKYWYGKDAFVPILHPLSDLTKEIEVNGEKFVPIELMFPVNKNPNSRAKPQFLKEATCKLSEGKVSPYHLEYCVIENLFKLHIDVFGLIEKGLAIDINTLTPTK